MNAPHWEPCTKPQPLSAYGVDHAGNELFQIVVKDLETGTSYPERSKMPITALSGAAIMPRFSSRVDEAHRPDRLFRTSR